MGKYNLSFADAEEARDLVFSLDVFYSIDADKIRVEVGRRRDVKDKDFELRLAQQVEMAMRAMFTHYGGEMNLVEQLAGLTVPEGEHPKRSIRGRAHSSHCDCMHD